MKTKTAAAFKNETTASVAYAARRSCIAMLMREMQKDLEAMDAAQAKDATNWGYVGTCSHIVDSLIDVIQSAKIPK